METEPIDNFLLLVRAPGSGDRGGRIVAGARKTLSECRGDVRVFFHGPGIDHATNPIRKEWLELVRSGRVRLQVCSAAWRRREEGEVPEGFEASSLVQFWNRALAGDRIKCFGVGDGH